MTDASATGRPWEGPGIREFIALMAALMAANAFAIDTILPALPAIGAALDVTDANRRQLVITVFMLGFGVAQIVYGPVSDHFGRKRVLAISLSCYVVMSFVVGIAASFPLLLAARVFQGIAAGGSRVLVVSIVRDRFHGAEMARVMSITMIVFMLVPLLAPAVGQAILAWSSWRMIFFLLTAFAFANLVWAMLRLPETLPEERRRPLSLSKLREATATTLSHPLSIGNTLALTVILGALFGFINSIQQIIFDVFHAADSLPLLFATIAGCMAVASYLNSVIVMRFGMRKIMLVGLFAFVGVALVHLAMAYFGGETLILFCVLQGLCMACFGLVSANMASIAMQPLGHIAGTASSLQGAITTLGAALIGLVIGQLFDGSTLPLVAGFVICGLVSLALTLWANREEPFVEPQAAN
jgi:DHA1 family bicyclomycin/chloramphenicol resistance-like MFS transporter